MLCSLSGSYQPLAISQGTDSARQQSMEQSAAKVSSHTMPPVTPSSTVSLIGDSAPPLVLLTSSIAQGGHGQPSTVTSTPMAPVTTRQAPSPPSDSSSHHQGLRGQTHSLQPMSQQYSAPSGASNTTPPTSPPLPATSAHFDLRGCITQGSPPTVLRPSSVQMVEQALHTATLGPTSTSSISNEIFDQPLEMEMGSTTPPPSPTPRIIHSPPQPSSPPPSKYARYDVGLTFPTMATSQHGTRGE